LEQATASGDGQAKVAGAHKAYGFLRSGLLAGCCLVALV